MAEMTLEQQRAIAMASARLRMQQNEQIQEPAQQQMPATPPDTRTPIRRVGEAAVAGFMQGNLPMMGLNTIREIGSIGQENLNRSAYQAGGAVTDFATRMGASPEVAAGTGFATNVGIQALPVIAGAGIGKVFEPVAHAGAQRLMQSAMKPSMQMRESGAAERAADTMLKYGVNATKGGREELQNMVSTLETQIDDILQKSPAQVDKYAVASSLRSALNKVRTNLSAKADTAAIQEAFGEFINHPLLNNTTLFPVSVANKMKQSIYQALGPNAYAPGVKTGVPRLIDKTIARGLRENVGRAEPAVTEPLAQQAELLEALKVMGPQALRDANRNIVGLGALSPSVENLLVWLIDRNPWTKSMLARGLNSGALNTGIGAGAGGLVGYQMGQPK